GELRDRQALRRRDPSRERDHVHGASVGAPPAGPPSGEFGVKEVAVHAEQHIVTRRFALLAAFAALTCVAPAAALAESTILVKFASTTGSSAKVEALGDQVDGTTLTGVKVVDPQPGESVSEALERYQARPDVVYAEPNRVVHLL